MTATKALNLYLKRFTNIAKYGARPKVKYQFKVFNGVNGSERGEEIKMRGG